MFDDVDIGSNFDTGDGYTIGGGYDAGQGYDGSSLGQYLGQADGSSLVSPEWGSQSDVYDDGMNSPLAQIAAQTMATQPSSATGYNTQGLGQYGSQSGGDPSKADAILNRDYTSSEKQNPIAKGFGLPATKDGTGTDWTDPKTITSLVKALGIGGNFLSQLMNKGKQQNAQTATQLAQTLPVNAHNNWTPTQQQWADRFFNTPYQTATRPKQYAADMQSPIVAGKGYAEGGDVMGPMEDDGPTALGLVAGDGGGQADDVNVNLSGGEYVFSADIVSALGDGNNAAGAKKLDELGEAIRARARSTPPNELPPEAEHPAETMGLGEMEDELDMDEGEE